MASDEEYMCNLAANITTLEEAYLHLVDAGDRFVINVVYPCIMALGIITNGAFCVVIGRISRMHTITNLYLVNLAVADLTFLIVAVSEKLARLAASPVIGDETFYGLTGCIVVPFILNCTYFASIFIVTLVSVERFYAICWPLQHRMFSSLERTVKLLIGAWFLSVICSAFFIPGRARLDVICVQWPADLVSDNLPPVVTFCSSVKIFSWFQHVVNFLQTVPFFIAAIANTIMYAKILKTMHQRVGAQDQLAEVNNRVAHVRNQVATMLIANGTVFFLCQMLFQGVSVALAFRHLRAQPILTIVQIDKVLLVARILSYLNSAVNAIVYNIFSSRYRRAFRETFCWRRARRVHPSGRVSRIVARPGDAGQRGQQAPSGSGQNDSMNHPTRTTDDTPC